MIRNHNLNYLKYSYPLKKMWKNKRNYIDFDQRARNRQAYYQWRVNQLFG